MKRLVLLAITICLLSLGVYAQKTVYIPSQFSAAPWNQWSWDKTYQSTNFVIFWGNVVGTNPATYSNPDLRFDPAQLAGYLEASFTKFVTEIGFVPNTGKLGTYKIIVVMNDTYTGSGGPTGWAFGGSYDNMIGAMWVHPGATRDPYVLSHELAHSLQGQNNIQQNPNGGFVNYEPGGWFWECHANYMRCVEFPTFASEDLPRWLMTRHFHVASTRHHYSTFKWLMNIQQNYGGYNTVNRLWRESIANETATEAWRRISGWTQAQLCNNMYDYAKREVNYDYPAQGFGADIRAQVNIYKTQASENWWLWREYTILDQINASNGRYSVPRYMAPQDYGVNLIPLYPNCTSNAVHIKFKGHTEVNAQAGWRWGFVEVTSGGTSIYSPMQSSATGEATYTLTAGTSKLYLVVMGAPTAKHDYVWEPGFPKIHRYPYEVRIENAVPEGYQSNFRADLKSLFPGSVHANGGGWVANTATVASSVYVGPKAVVLGSSNLSGSVRVEGTARLQNVTANGSAKFAGNCNVNGGTYTNTAQVIDGAILFNSNLSGNATFKDVAWAWGSTYGNGVVVGGDAEIGSCSTPGVYLQTPHSNNGRSACDGLGASHTSNIDINASYTNFTDAEMSWTAIGCSSCTPTSITPYTQVGSGAWTQTASATVSAGTAVKFGPAPATGGSWSWTGPNGYTASTREITISNVQSNLTGTYIAKHTNACGAQTTQNFTIALSGSGTSTNIAPLATRSTSYVSPWETLVAVNDGFVPANSNDKSQGAYGNWNNPNSIQWVQYDWTQNYTVTSAEVYWFNDGGGVLTPTTAYIEYWNGSSWVKLADVPLQTNAFNVVNINSVSLSRLRVSMLNTTQSTGILEWRVMGYASASARQAVVTITDEEKSGSIVTYPNPASSEFAVELKGFDATENVELQMLDLQGRVMHSKQMGTSRTTTYSKSVLNVKGAVYILKAIGTKRIISGKIILVD